MAHSMGGLDCKHISPQSVHLNPHACFLPIGRHLISHIKPTEYTPLSLTTISTPHRGSPFMDWCAVCFTRTLFFSKTETYFFAGEYWLRAASPTRTPEC